MNIADTTSEK